MSLGFVDFYRKGTCMKFRHLIYPVLLVALCGCSNDPIRLGEFVDAPDPRIEVFQPGTILLVKPNGDVAPVHSNAWLNELNLQVVNDSGTGDKKDCSDQSTQDCIVSMGGLKLSALDMHIKAELANGSAELKELSSTASNSAIMVPSMMRLSDKSDVNDAFDKFRKSDAYKKFAEEVKTNTGNETGILVIVSMLEVIPYGFIELKFNQNIPPEMRDALVKGLKLSGGLKYTFDEDTLRLEASKDRPILKKWRLDKISL
jgi:hypothetical protein